MVLALLGGVGAYAAKLGPFAPAASVAPSAAVVPGATARPSASVPPSFNVSVPPLDTTPPAPSGSTLPPVSFPASPGLPSGLPSLSIPPLPTAVPSGSVPPLPSISIPPLPSGLPSLSIPPLPTAGPSGSIPPGPTEPAPGFPNAEEAALLEHVPEDLRASCSRTSSPTEGATASLVCTSVPGTDNGTPTVVQYSQMQDADAMNAAYDSMVLALGATEDSAGDCESDEWPQENEYVVGDDPDAPAAGRYVCGLLGGTVPQIAWTDDELDVFSFALRFDTLRTELYEFWTTAGPF